MEKNYKPAIAIFKNEKAGQPVLKKDGSVVEYNGNIMLQPFMNGKITLPEGLPAGDYDVGIYQKESKKGLKYYQGTIKPAFKKVDKHNESKANAYVAESEELDLSDDIPF